MGRPYICVTKLTKDSPHEKGNFHISIHRLNAMGKLNMGRIPPSAIQSKMERCNASAVCEVDFATGDCRHSFVVFANAAHGIFLQRDLRIKCTAARWHIVSAFVANDY